MEQKSSIKGKANRFMQFQGKIRGVALKNYADFIINNSGPESLKKVESLTAKAGCLIKYEQLKPMEFYPLGYLSVTIEAIKEALGYSDEQFYKMGGFEPKISFILKLFVKFFVSLKKIAGEAPKIWEKYYTVGSLKVAEVNEKRRYIVLRLEDFPSKPPHCSQILSGYFARVVQMVLGTDVVGKETKCIHKGDAFHEYLLEW